MRYDHTILLASTKFMIKLQTHKFDCNSTIALLYGIEIPMPGGRPICQPGTGAGKDEYLTVNRSCRNHNYYLKVNNRHKKIICMT